MDQYLKLTTLIPDREESYQLDLTTDWIAQLLSELEENSETSATGNLNCQLNIMREINPTLGDHVGIIAEITGSYHTTCVRCLESTEIPIEINFAACYVSQSLEKTPEFEELEEVFCQGQEMDLYFHQGKIDLKELLHENIYLQLEPFPLHHPDCKGLCPICGVNLNKESCTHQKNLA